MPNDIREKIVNYELADTVPAIAESADPAEQDDRQTVHARRCPDPTQLKDWQREIRDARLAILSVVQEMAQTYGGVTKAEAALAKHSKDPNTTMSPELVKTLRTANARRGASCRVGSSTLRLWRRTRSQYGPDALAPAPMERKQGDEQPNWVRPFMKAYCHPSNPSISQAYEKARKSGEAPDLPSKRTVERYLQSLPILQSTKGRLGPRERKSLRAYTKRTTDELRPGDVYTADGHTAQFECKHPEHGQPVRPEIISVLDVKTRKCVGLSIELNERALLVADALRVACQWHGIPAIFYIDNGCGFKNELLNGPAFGMFHRLGITPKYSLPYNSQARGVIERFNGSCWKGAAKDLPYVGHDMDKEAKQRSYKRSRKELKETGDTKELPNWEQMLVWAMQTVLEYNSRPHSELPMITDQETGKKRHMTPEESWEHLAQDTDIIKPTQVEIDDMKRPYVIRKTTRCMVRARNGVYYAPELQDYHGHQVGVGIDIWDPHWVWVRDMEGRLITVAQLDAHARPYFPASYVEQAREKRDRERRNRLERKEGKMLDLAQERIENGGEPAPEAEQPSADQLQAQRELEAELQQEQEKPSREETPLERFRRAKRLEDRLADGETVSEEDARWLRGYQRTSEYGGYQDMFEDFGEAIFG
jgi:putative transposase